MTTKDPEGWRQETRKCKHCGVDYRPVDKISSFCSVRCICDWHAWAYPDAKDHWATVGDFNPKVSEPIVLGIDWAQEGADRTVEIRRAVPDLLSFNERPQ